MKTWRSLLLRHRIWIRGREMGRGVGGGRSPYGRAMSRDRLVNGLLVWDWIPVFKSVSYGSFDSVSGKDRMGHEVSVKVRKKLKPNRRRHIHFYRNVFPLWDGVALRGLHSEMGYEICRPVLSLAATTVDKAKRVSANCGFVNLEIHNLSSDEQILSDLAKYWLNIGLIFGRHGAKKTCSFPAETCERTRLFFRLVFNFSFNIHHLAFLCLDFGTISHEDGTAFVYLIYWRWFQLSVECGQHDVSWAGTRARPRDGVAFPVLSQRNKFEHKAAQSCRMWN